MAHPVAEDAEYKYLQLGGGFRRAIKGQPYDVYGMAL
jgi:hypothetical protein